MAPVRKMRIWTLTDWPEDRYPTCSMPDCGKPIENGHGYVVLPDTIKMVCVACTAEPVKLKEAREKALVSEHLVTLSPTARKRVLRALAPKQPRAPRGPRAPRTRSRSTAARTYNSQNLRAGRPRKYEDRPCGSCGELFSPRTYGARGLQKYCSHPCQTLGRRKRTKSGTCPACDRAFYPKKHGPRGVQECCSRSCARFWKNGRRNPDPPKLVWSRAWGDQCRHCGRSDVAHRGQGYCDRCYKNHRQRGGVTRAKEPVAPNYWGRKPLPEGKETTEVAG